MKNRKLMIGAAALFFAAAASVSSAAFAGELPVVTRANMKAEVVQADRPVLLLTCSNDAVQAAACLSNEKALAAQVAAHPELKIVESSERDSGLAPGLYTYVPGAGLTYQQPGFDATKVDAAFFAKRAEFAAKEAEAVKNMQAVAARVKAQTGPADEKIRALEQENTALYTEARKKLDLVRAEQRNDPALEKLKQQHQKTAAPYDKRIAALQKQIDQLQERSARANAATDAKIEQVQAAYAARRNEISKEREGKVDDLQKRYGVVAAEREAAAAPFAAEVKASRKALETLVEQDQPAE
ncbi:MAG: hypothetical protein JSS86_04800 [Cyanobacteria bacterium SZAS LIN-2]|nr:hypothetical protein [Cyanobacteria bacterium SZAS LIN-2]